jgi:hypothetical protein
LSDLDDYVVPNWHKDIVLKRLETLKNNPADLISVETLFDELEKDLK